MRKIYILGAMALCLFASCEDCEYDTADKYAFDLVDLGGGGEFLIINTTSKDTLRGADLSLLSDTLAVRANDIVKISFEKAEKYSDYTFKTTYTLHNDSVIADQSEYVFIIEDSEVGCYEVNLKATASGSAFISGSNSNSINGHEQSSGYNYSSSYEITAEGAFTLNVVE